MACMGIMIVEIELVSIIPELLPLIKPCDMGPGGEFCIEVCHCCNEGLFQHYIECFTQVRTTVSSVG